VIFRFSSIDLKEKRKQILDIAYRHGIKNVRLFGSFARKKEKEDSDVDLLVTFEEGRPLFDLIAFKNNLEDMKGDRIYLININRLLSLSSRYAMCKP
jgi:hypothetical protein